VLQNENRERIAIVGTLAETMVGFRGELIKHLVGKGHEVFAIAAGHTNETKAQIEALGATPLNYNLEQFGLNPFKELRAVWQLKALFRQYRISVVLSYFAKPSIYGTLAAWLARVPHRVAKIEGLGRIFTDDIRPMNPTLEQRYRHAKKLWIRTAMVRLYKLSLPKAQHVVFLNHDDKHELIQNYGVKIAKSTVIGGIGVCLQHYATTLAPVEPFRFIFVGRLLNEKGIREYLGAAEHLKAKYPEVEFWVLGQPDTNRFAITPQELNAYVERGIVEYPGKVANVVPFLQQSSVFVLPSYYREGVPRSTQEALAVGRAVITTNMPGCKDTVEQNRNGVLIEPRNQNALAQAMEQLIQNPEQVQKMGLESRTLATMRFDVRKINETLEHLIIPENRDEPL